MFDPKIQDTIEYRTRQIAKTCNLDTQTTDDVRQELTLTALEAIKNYTPDMNANLLTYVKAALGRGAAGVLRKIRNTPPTVHADGLLMLAEIQDDYQRQAGPNTSCQPLTISMSANLEQIAVSPSEYDLELQLDIEAILKTFSLRHRAICRMLMDGYTLQEIAGEFHVTKQRIHRIIRRIRTILENNSPGSLTEFPFLQLSTYRGA